MFAVLKKSDDHLSLSEQYASDANDDIRPANVGVLENIRLRAQTINGTLEEFGLSWSLVKEIAVIKNIFYLAHGISADQNFTGMLSFLKINPLAITIHNLIHNDPDWRTKYTDKPGYITGKSDKEHESGFYLAATLEVLAAINERAQSRYHSELQVINHNLFVPLYYLKNLFRQELSIPEKIEIIGDELCIMYSDRITAENRRGLKKAGMTQAVSTLSPSAPARHTLPPLKTSKSLEEPLAKPSASKAERMVLPPHASTRKMSMSSSTPGLFGAKAQEDVATLENSPSLLSAELSMVFSHSQSASTQHISLEPPEEGIAIKPGYRIARIKLEEPALSVARDSLSRDRSGLALFTEERLWHRLRRCKADIFAVGVAKDAVENNMYYVADPIEVLAVRKRSEGETGSETEPSIIIADRDVFSMTKLPTDEQGNSDDLVDMSRFREDDFLDKMERFKQACFTILNRIKTQTLTPQQATQLAQIEEELRSNSPPAMHMGFIRPSEYVLYAWLNKACSPSRESLSTPMTAEQHAFIQHGPTSGYVRGHDVELNRTTTRLCGLIETTEHEDDFEAITAKDFPAISKTTCVLHILDENRVLLTPKHQTIYFLLLLIHNQRPLIHNPLWDKQIALQINYNEFSEFVLEHQTTLTNELNLMIPTENEFINLQLQLAQRYNLLTVLQKLTLLVNKLSMHCEFILVCFTWLKVNLQSCCQPLYGCCGRFFYGRNGVPNTVAPDNLDSPRLLTVNG